MSALFAYVICLLFLILPPLGVGNNPLSPLVFEIFGLEDVDLRTHILGLYRICFWEIRLELDFAGFVKQIRPELVPEPDFTIIISHQ